MRIGVLGTGMVGETIASRMVELGHTVVMGSRSAQNPKAVAWAAAAGARGAAGSFADAAAASELLFNCTHGAASIEALTAAGEPNLRGKVLLDVTNPLDLSHGMPPGLFVSGNDSLGEQIQRAFPALRVVKTLNTVNCKVMVDPGRVPGAHSMFVCGNDADARRQAVALLAEIGWRDVIDLGDLSGARALEQLMPIWLRLWSALGTADFNLGVVR